MIGTDTEAKLTWVFDSINNTWDGHLGGQVHFVVEPTSKGATIYQLKKRVGNFLDMPSVEAAKEYCEKIKPTI